MDLTDERCFEKISRDVKRKISEGSQILREVHDSDEKRGLIRLKSECYRKRGILESNLGDRDCFDDYARFFVLGDEGEVQKVLRAVNRNNPLGIIPTELNLKSFEEIKNFVKELKKDCKSVNWRESEMDYSRENLRSLLKKYRDSDSVYEIGGFSGNDKDSVSSLMILLGIGQVGYSEKWDLVIQTNHPKHTQFYKYFGFPYREIAGHTQNCIDPLDGRIKRGYLDYCGRAAQTLALEGNEFQERFGEIIRIASVSDQYLCIGIF